MAEKAWLGHQKFRCEKVGVSRVGDFGLYAQELSKTQNQHFKISRALIGGNKGVLDPKSQYFFSCLCHNLSPQGVSSLNSL